MCTRDQTGCGYAYDLLYWTGWVQGEHSRGIWSVECVTAHCRWFEEVLESELSSGLMLMNTATQAFKSRSADTEEYFCGLPPTLINWWPSWVITLLYLWSSEENVPGFVRGNFPTEYMGFMAVVILVASVFLGWKKLALVNSCGGWYVGFSTTSHRFFQLGQLDVCELYWLAGLVWTVWERRNIHRRSSGHDRPL